MDNPFEYPDGFENVSLVEFGQTCIQGCIGLACLRVDSHGQNISEDTTPKNEVAKASHANSSGTVLSQ